MSSQPEGFPLWDPAQADLPPRPDDPSRYPESDARRWYDAEFAWRGLVRRDLPRPPGGGAHGRCVEVALPGFHPYWTEYEQGLTREASRLGMTVRVHHLAWDPDQQHDVVDGFVRRRPDIVILVPAEPFLATDCFRRLAQAGIPVVAGNQTLEEESYSGVVSWVGPNDWGQQRLLARHFARLMANSGGYCIVSHRPGTSAYLARVWGIRTELGRVAPEMACLDVRYTDLDRSRTRMAVATWLERFGSRLRGIVCADDASSMEGVKRALVDHDRTDVVCVANGATRRGFELLKEGTLKAITYQSPELEGILAVRTAADWFAGIAVEPIRFLPARIVTAEDADSFLTGNQALETPLGDDLSRILAETHLEELNLFFENMHHRVAESPAMSVDYFRGLIVEMIAAILNLAQRYEVDGISLFGGHETLYRGIAVRENPADALDWVQSRAVALLDTLVSRGTPASSLVDRMISYSELHFASPLALKTLGERFGFSPAYLGKLFRERTGNSYARFLNELRVRKAKLLLRAGHLRVGEVARAVGYADTGYFSQVFRRIVGVSPAEFAEGDG